MQPETYGDFDPAAHEAEAAARWPATFAASQRRTSGYTAEQWKQAAAAGDGIAAQFAELMAAGDAAAGEAAMDLAEDHRLSIDRWYYPCSKQMHRGLGEIYVTDPRFRDYWEQRAPGLASYVAEAIRANAAR